MRTTSRKACGLPNACCTPGEASANAPGASSRRNASIWRSITARISSRSEPVTRPSAAAGRQMAAASASNAMRTVFILLASQGFDRGDLRAAQHALKARALGHHLLRVLRGFVARRAVVLLQPGLEAAGAV